MTTKSEKPNRLTAALLETADDLRSGGLIGQAAHEKITARHLGKDITPGLQLLSGEEIKAMRERANLSQAVFARCLNLTTGYVSQLERGAKRPTGAALALLNVIQRHGIQAVL